MKEYLGTKMLLLLLLFCKVCFSYAGNCEQVITVKFIPEPGVKLYGIMGGNNGKRAVVDLGHFNTTSLNHTIKIGHIDVGLKLEKTSNSNSEENDIELINVKKLEEALWNYDYEITSFIEGKDGIEANIKIENANVDVNGEKLGDIVYFVCEEEVGGEHNHPELKYSFDLLLELNNLKNGGMYGVSSPKNNGTEAYVNLKDLIKDQLSLSTATKP